MDIIKELISKPLESISIGIQKEATHLISNRLLEYQVEEFKRSYQTKTILHRTAPVRLYDFYQPLFIRRFGNNFRDERISSNSPSEMFKKSNLITLLGTAGSGKSTIVKFLLLQCVEEKYKTPIRVELRYLNKYDGSLIDYVENDIFSRQQLAVDKRIMNRLLHSGEFVFFLDGYDELSSKVKERITKDINDFTQVYNKNDYLLTSRPYTNVELLSRFHNYEVCEMNDFDIEQFVRKQMSKGEEEITEKILESIKGNSNNGSYNTFLSNPLLLSMFILTFQNYSNIPPKKSTFYSQVFDSLFHLHDSMSKLAYEREKTSGLSKEQFETVLKLFSYISLFKQTFVFDNQFVNDTFNQIKSAKKDIEFDNDKFIDDLQVAICIFQKEGLDYVFPHRSLQEYFASQYIVGLLPNQKKDVYAKILNQFVEFKFLELITNDNFFSLLIEQDELGVIRHLSIPLIEHCNKVLRSENDTQKKEMVLSTLFFYIFSFHSDSEIFSELESSLKNYNEERSIIIRKYNYPTEEEKVKMDNEDANNLDRLFEGQVKETKSKLPKLTRELRSYIKAEVESDNLIINLI